MFPPGFFGELIPDAGGGSGLTIEDLRAELDARFPPPPTTGVVQASPTPTDSVVRIAWSEGFAPLEDQLARRALVIQSGPRKESFALIASHPGGAVTTLQLDPAKLFAVAPQVGDVVAVMGGAVKPEDY